MKKLLFSLTIFCVLTANAQTYLITFTGTGTSTTVSTVKVENLSKGTSLTLNGSDILRLTVPADVNSFENKQSTELKIYPNPMTDNSTLQIYPLVAGDAIITVFDMTGKLVVQIKSYLENYLQEFRLSGLNNGVYLISVKGSSFQYTEKLLCNSKANGTIRIEKISSNQAAKEKTVKMDHKGDPATIDMAYTTGNKIKFTGISGNFSTVKTDIPAGDKTITFNFIACTDGDGNNYPVVEIGTQTWMAENLKTTKYSDSTAIPLVTDNTAWTNLTTAAYCWYGNNEATYKNTYGALYNWYTGNTGILCPAGWHIPTDPEWTTLANYLSGNAGKLKETGIIHWQSPNSGATNETGFTALPGGYRYSVLHLGTFGEVGFDGDWWSATESSSTYAWNLWMGYNYTTVSRENDNKTVGFSVRCLKN